MGNNNHNEQRGRAPFDFTMNIPTIIVLVGVILALAREWQQSSDATVAMQKQVDKHEVRLDHHDDELDSLKQFSATVKATQSETAQAVSEMRDFVHRLPPPPDRRGHGNMEGQQ